MTTNSKILSLGARAVIRSASVSDEPVRFYSTRDPVALHTSESSPPSTPSGDMQALNVREPQLVSLTTLAGQLFRCDDAPAILTEQLRSRVWPRIPEAFWLEGIPLQGIAQSDDTGSTQPGLRQYTVEYDASYYADGCVDALQRLRLTTLTSLFNSHGSAHLFDFAIS
ncbi:hypothetical protein BV25DRAFT_1918842 [Artomyces pyxidatus]|uniref:Uncharacterized protein n=1 Tax=Artomyces pyxidatus TaxID=48021 RepID=A0ACB8SRT4_9AGAM|nr:hypothetical protein BV25DRAFT_1918842 [Artomyces pyxidatus]